MTDSTPDLLRPLTDSFGREMKYLRVSLTDRCNFRCTYCRPENKEVKTHDEMLSFEEVARVVSIVASLGVNKVRLTGGEPLVRKGVVDCVQLLSGIEGITDLAMTTNAVLLDMYAARLKAAGLSRLNVSFDTLDHERFSRLTAGGKLSEVIKGLNVAVEEGLVPIKLNTVLMRGFNDEEVPAIIDFAADHGFTPRFIEFMPMSDGLDWKKSYISVDELLERDEVRARIDLTAMESRDHTASLYLPLKDGRGEVGFITPISKRFCDHCNRLRLTADGRLRVCLPSDEDADLKKAMRAGATDEDLINIIRNVVLRKPESGEYTYETLGRKRSMVEIGG